jgi:uncharacterized protein YdhG (YjbR/CyaY superfamily)
MKKFRTVGEYIAAQPETARTRLEELRETIRQTAPQAEEVMSYNIPAFKYNGALLVWYAAFKRHIGFYPKASGITEFKKELARYKTSKGAIQFPLDKSVPATLVKRIVKFRVKQNSAKAVHRPFNR